MPFIIENFGSGFCDSLYFKFGKPIKLINLFDKSLYNNLEYNYSHTKRQHTRLQRYLNLTTFGLACKTLILYGRQDTPCLIFIYKCVKQTYLKQCTSAWLSFAEFVRPVVAEETSIEIFLSGLNWWPERWKQEFQYTYKNFFYLKF